VPPVLLFFSTHAAWAWFMVVQCVFHPCVPHVMAHFCYGCLSRSPHSFKSRLVARPIYFVELILRPYLSFYKIFLHVLVMKLACHLSLHFACNFVSFYEQRAYLQVPVWAPAFKHSIMIHNVIPRGYGMPHECAGGNIPASVTSAPL
jgi:hypothetical protein